MATACLAFPPTNAMPTVPTGKGKKRELYFEQASDTPSKKSRKAETRDCPVCGEAIPLRLLAKHAELEDERVESIIQNVGSEVILDKEIEEFVEGSSTRTRRSAIKARMSFSSSTPVADAKVNKILQTIKRNRKQRHGRLKDMIRDDENGILANTRRLAGRGEIVCPVCQETVRGDDDVLDAHVDACLADAARKAEAAEHERRAREEAEVDVTWDDAESAGFGHVGDVRGTGFLTRNPTDRDVEDDIDVDGDDEAVFGHAQFSEGDILSSNTPRTGTPQSERAEDSEGKPLAVPSTDGQLKNGAPFHIPDDVDKLDLAIISARKKRDNKQLVAALENKLKHLESTPAALVLSCRICLDPYTEPTASTGCWHTCCRECWLRCLGSTKLCPICKRITAAGDLRRVFL